MAEASDKNSLTNLDPCVIIIKILINYNIYNKYINYINLNNIKYKSKELYNIYLYLNKYINKFKKDLTLEELEALVVSEQPENSEVYQSIFVQLRDADISQVVVTDILDSIAQKALAQEVALKAFELAEGRATADEVVALANSLTVESLFPELEENQFVSDDLEDIANDTVKTPGLRWRLQTLNSMLGSLRLGDFGFVFARPETGKTTFLASEITFMAGQATAPVVWFNNEEQGSKVMLRCYQAALGLTLPQLLSDIGKYRDRYYEETGRRIKLVDNAGISKNDVERVCKTQHPSLIIFDQIDKIKGFDADRDDLHLGAIYQWARELAKIYAPVIGICQADGSGEGIKWLNMGHVANAKTSKQAEADWILGIGRTNDTGMEFVRHFHLSKNKLIGDEDSVPDLRHGKRDVIIRPEIARYADVGS